MSRLTDIEVNAADRYAIVGAGASWTNVAAALKPTSGMAATQISPISEPSLRSAGLASQGIPTRSRWHSLVLVVVLADGSVVQTGAPARFPSLRRAGCDGSLFSAIAAHSVSRRRSRCGLRLSCRATSRRSASPTSINSIESMTACMGERLVTRGVRNGSGQAGGCQEGRHRRGGQDGSGDDPACRDIDAVGQRCGEAAPSRGRRRRRTAVVAASHHGIADARSVPTRSLIASQARFVKSTASEAMTCSLARCGPSPIRSGDSSGRPANAGRRCMASSRSPVSARR